jgi:hypothetical protein
MVLLGLSLLYVAFFYDALNGSPDRDVVAYHYKREA